LSRAFFIVFPIKKKKSKIRKNKIK